MGTVTESSIEARVVLYGPPGSGKTHTLEFISSRLKSGQKGDLRTEHAGGDSYEVLPVKLGAIKGLETAFDFVAAPGAWELADERTALLENVDGVIFVANSRGDAMADNKKSLAELEEGLKRYGKSLVGIPVVFQWNMQRAMGAMPPDEMTAKLNSVRAPAYSVNSDDPRGILQVFTTISKITLKKLREDFEAGRLQTEPSQPSVEIVAEPPEPVVEEPLAPEPVEDDPFGQGGDFGADELDSMLSAVDASNPQAPAPLEAVPDIPVEPPAVEAPVAVSGMNGEVEVRLAGAASVAGDGSVEVPVTVQLPEQEVTLKIAIRLTRES
jgi:signal recognition particle receptor subunit beta